MFIVVVYFVIDSVRKLLVTPSYFAITNVTGTHFSASNRRAVIMVVDCSVYSESQQVSIRMS